MKLGLRLRASNAHEWAIRTAGKQAVQLASLINTLPNRRFTFSVLSLAIFLSACAPVHLREDATLGMAQKRRESVLAQHPVWSISARIAVSNGDDAGSAQLEWRQDGDHFDFSVHAPITGKTSRLFGNREQAVLEGLEAAPAVGKSAEDLLWRKLGWRVPVEQLADWIRGARSKGPATITYNEESLPAVLQQSGWTVEYKDYFSELSPPLPRKVFAAKKPYKVRLVIERWTLDE